MSSAVGVGRSLAPVGGFSRLYGHMSGAFGTPTQRGAGGSGPFVLFMASKSNPIGEAFDYAKELESLALVAVKREDVMRATA